MSALYTALLEGETKESLASMVCDLRAQNATLREALVEARDDVASWGEYASPYFQEKWDLKGNLARIDALLATTEAGEETK